MKLSTLTRIVGSLSLGGLVALAGCKSEEKPADEGSAGEPAAKPAEGEGGSCGGEGGCSGSCGGK